MVPSLVAGHYFIDSLVACSPCLNEGSTGLMGSMKRTNDEPIPVAARAKVWVAAARLLGLQVRIPPGAWMSVASVVCCQVEVPASGRSLSRGFLPTVVCLSVIVKHRQ